MTVAVPASGATGPATPGPLIVGIASFKANRTSGPAPLSIGAIVNATGAATVSNFTYNWTFGDGSFLNVTLNATGGPVGSSQVFHNYTGIGQFILFVKVSDNVVPDGSTTSRKIAISTTPTLAVGVAISPPNVTAGNLVVIQALPTGGLPPYHLLSFSSVPSGCAQAGFFTNCTPASQGVWTVKATVSDATGTVRSGSAPLHVYAALTLNAGQTTSYSCVAGTGVLIGNFTAITTGGTPTPTVTWSFGDGSPNVTGTSVSHQFALGPDYDILARANDTGGGFASESFVVVGNYPACGTTAPPTFHPSVLLLEIATLGLFAVVVVLAFILYRSIRAERRPPRSLSPVVVPDQVSSPPRADRDLDLARPRG